MDKEDVYTWRWKYCSTKKWKKFCHAITWMDIEGMTLSDIKLDRGRQVLSYIIYMWNLKKVNSQEMSKNGGYSGGREWRKSGRHC